MRHPSRGTIAIFSRDEGMTGPASVDHIQGATYEHVRVDKPVASCDGQKPDGDLGGCSGHPLVYLALGEEGCAICPYCSRQFILEKQSDH